MADLAKVKRNVAKMVSMGAPETDIDAYIHSEGVTVDTVRLFDPKRDVQASHQERGSFMDPIRQGLSFGFADEIDGIQSGFNHLVQGKNPVEGFHAGVDRARGDLDAYRERHPIASTALEVAGAVPTAIVGGPVLNGGKGLYGAVRSGIVGGGLYGAGSSEGNPVERLDDAAIGGALGGITGAGLYGAGRQVQKMFKPQPKPQSAREILDRGGQMIDDVKKSDGAVKSENFKSSVAKMGRDATEMFADEVNEPKSMARLESFKQVPDADVHLGKVHAMRRATGQISGGSDGELARRMISQIDDLIEDSNTPEARKLIAGIKEYAKGKRAQTIENAISDADNAAAGFAKGIQAEMRKMLKSTYDLRGFNQTERHLMKQLLDGDFVSQMLGKIGSGDGVFGAAAGGIAGGWGGLITVPIISGLVKKLNQKGAYKAAQMLQATVANGGVMPKALPAPNLNTPAMVLGGQAGRLPQH